MWGVLYWGGVMVLGGGLLHQHVHTLSLSFVATRSDCRSLVQSLHLSIVNFFLSQWRLCCHSYRRHCAERRRHWMSCVKTINRCVDILPFFSGERFWKVGVLISDWLLNGCIVRSEIRRPPTGAVSMSLPPCIYPIIAQHR